MCESARSTQGALCMRENTEFLYGRGSGDPYALKIDHLCFDGFREQRVEMVFTEPECM